MAAFPFIRIFLPPKSSCRGPYKKQGKEGREEPACLAVPLLYRDEAFFSPSSPAETAPEMLRRDDGMPAAGGPAGRSFSPWAAGRAPTTSHHAIRDRRQATSSFLFPSSGSLLFSIGSPAADKQRSDTDWAPLSLPLDVSFFSFLSTNIGGESPPARTGCLLFHSFPSPLSTFFSFSRPPISAASTISVGQREATCGPLSPLGFSRPAPLLAAVETSTSCLFSLFPPFLFTVFFPSSSTHPDGQQSQAGLHRLPHCFSFFFDARPEPEFSSSPSPPYLFFPPPFPSAPRRSSVRSSKEKNPRVPLLYLSPPPIQSLFPFFPSPPPCFGVSAASGEKTRGS